MLKKIMLFACIGIMSCDKVKYLANVNVDLPYTQTAKVPQLDTSIHLPPGGISMSLPTEVIETNAQEALALYNTNADNIISVSLTDFVNQLSDAKSNFDFLDTVKIYISTPTKPEIMVAYGNNIKGSGSTLPLTCSDLNLKDYFLEEKIYMRIYGHFVDVPHVKDDYKLKLNFNMVANPISGS
jgi:hypothetical protein